jgi:thymidine phosphorylase
MDVKFGSGAFAASRAIARKLAKGIVTVGEDAGSRRRR